MLVTDKIEALRLISISSLGKTEPFTIDLTTIDNIPRQSASIVHLRAADNSDTLTLPTIRNISATTLAFHGQTMTVISQKRHQSDPMDLGDDRVGQPRSDAAQPVNPKRCRHDHELTESMEENNSSLRRSERVPMQRDRFHMELLVKGGELEFSQDEIRGQNQPGGHRKTQNHEQEKQEDLNGKALFDKYLKPCGWAYRKNTGVGELMNAHTFYRKDVPKEDLEENVTFFLSYRAIYLQHKKDGYIVDKILERGDKAAKKKKERARSDSPRRIAPEIVPAPNVSPQSSVETGSLQSTDKISAGIVTQASVSLPSQEPNGAPSSVSPTSQPKLVSIVDRLGRLERELGQGTEGTVSKRIAALEKQCDLEHGAGLSLRQRVDALEKEFGVL